ncbi:hybrid sensor histidine kinase/response regulator, partial [Neisseria gonorrhoeae]
AARIHATHRIVMVTPATRQDFAAFETAMFTGYLVKPLRASSLAARLTASPEIAAPSLVIEAVTEPAPTAPAAAPAGKGLSILVAEDNEINALLMRSLLARLGHDVVITTNGEQAMESWLSATSAGTPYDL